MGEPRIAPLAREGQDDKTADVLASIRRNEEGPDLRIFATLARHPKLLKRWSAFGGTLLYGGRLPARDREVLILRTGWRCTAEYEWGQHVEIGRAAGLTDEDIRRLAGPLDADGWPDLDRLLALAADELHDTSRLSDDTWAQLAERYDDQQLIEVCMVVGQYHLVAFTLNSLGVVPEDGLEPLPS